MTVHTTYAEARAHLASLLDRATHDRETVIISRRGGEDVALIAADELASLQETAHLLRSPANAARLLSALQRRWPTPSLPRRLTICDMRSVLPTRRDQGRDPRPPRQRGTVFQPEFREDLRYWVETDRRTALRILDLIEAIIRDPFQGIGKPEPLKHVGPNLWSRRITQEHRIVHLVR